MEKRDTDSQNPSARAVDGIIAEAVKDRASEIHIESQEGGVRVLFRIDGTLREATPLPLDVQKDLISRIKAMAKDGQFSVKVEDRPIDFRVTITETISGEAVFIRVLDELVSLLKLEELGFHPATLENMMRLLQSPFGMVMVSGPTGSGKTTTLYALLGGLDPKARKISTIEDPVEYRLPGIFQTQVQGDVTFARGLRGLMSMNPDIIMVGDIRDLETANLAVQAAADGRLVLGSIRANDAVSALIRLIDLGVEPSLVTSGVIAILSQRLVRKVCPYCRTLGTVSAEEAAAYQREIQEVRTDFDRGRGCNFCFGTGYVGRAAIIEIMAISNQIRRLVDGGAEFAEIRAKAIEEGIITMSCDGMAKVRDGITTPAEVLRNVFTIG